MLNINEMISALAEAIVLNKDGGCGELIECMGYSEYDEITIESIINELKNCDDINASALDYSSFENQPNDYKVQIVETRGGEGDGASMYCVVKITGKDDEGYIEFEGRYSSWDSSYYDNVYAVTPQETMVIKYIKVK